MGLARGGTPGGNSSGDIFIAFSTADVGPLPQESGPLLTRVELNNEWIDPVYLAAVEAAVRELERAKVVHIAGDLVLYS